MKGFFRKKHKPEIRVITYDISSLGKEYSIQLWLDGKQMGTAQIKNQSDVAYFHSFMLNEGVRGKGLGKFMLEKTIELLRGDSAFTNITLNVKPDNKNAIKLYEKLGFTVVGSEKTMFYMQKCLW